jgi:hypothetical protein
MNYDLSVMFHSSGIVVSGSTKELARSKHYKTDSQYDNTSYYQSNPQIFDDVAGRHAK